VEPEEVDEALREGIEYYLSSASDPDFYDDDALYDTLPLDVVRG
jgi:CCR4-NOT transcriptional regulation complex NOT5 subunit